MNDEFAADMTNVLLTVIDSCPDYMRIYHRTFLMHAGYPTPTDYCNFMECNPNQMDGLAVMLTSMLNRVYVCIHHKGGMWHTHVKTQPCTCSLHMATMGNNTFVALEKIPYAAQKKPKVLQVKPVVEDNTAVNPNPNDNDEPKVLQVKPVVEDNTAANPNPNDDDK